MQFLFTLFGVNFLFSSMLGLILTMVLGGSLVFGLLANGTPITTTGVVFFLATVVAVKKLFSRLN